MLGKSAFFTSTFIDSCLKIIDVSIPKMKKYLRYPHQLKTPYYQVLWYVIPMLEILKLFMETISENGM